MAADGGSRSPLGIECPRGARNLPGLVQEAEPFSEEATLFAKELVLQREVGWCLCVLASPCCLSLLGLDAFVRSGSSRPSGGVGSGMFPCWDRGQRPKDLPQLFWPLHERLPPALDHARVLLPLVAIFRRTGWRARLAASPGEPRVAATLPPSLPVPRAACVDIGGGRSGGSYPAEATCFGQQAQLGMGLPLPCLWATGSPARGHSRGSDLGARQVNPEMPLQAAGLAVALRVDLLGPVP